MTGSLNSFRPRKLPWTEMTILAAVALVVAATWWQKPRGFLHPDALIFTNFCQAALASVKTWQDLPGALGEALRNCSHYDWNRGRITGYLLFLLGGVTRPQLGTGFLDPVALVLMAINAWMAAALLQKYTRGRSGPTGCLLAAILLLSPFSLVAVQTQFIYAKFICVSFVLGALWARTWLGKMLCIVGAVFSDEIGLLFGMIYGAVLLIGKVPWFQPSTPWQKTRALGGAGLWVGAVWAGYHLALQLFFGKTPHLMKKSKALPGWDQLADALLYPLKTLLYGWNLLFLTPPASGDGPSLWSGFPWPAWLAWILVPGIGFCLWQAVRLRSVKRLLSQPHPHGAESIRDLGSLLVTLGIVNFVFYKGQMGDYGYYGYPLWVGLSLGCFLLLDLLDEAAARGVGVLLVVAALCALPATQKVIRERIAKEHLDGAIPLQQVAELERMLLETGQREPLPAAFISGQDLAITTFNRFKKEYFPVKGIARIFLWPRPLPGPRPTLTIGP